MKSEKNILVAFILNLIFSIFEFIGGIFTNSISILSDSVHDFGDAISIGVSYFLENKSKKKADYNYTYGYLRYSVLGAFITTTILIIGSVLFIYNSIIRFFNPVEVHYDGMILIAVVGVIINLAATYYTKSGKSLNQKAVNLHMIEDVLGWGIVLIGAILIKFTRINIIDSLLSLIVSGYILIHSLKSLKEILDIFLLKVPKNIDVKLLKEELEKIEGVKDIHHMHLWSIDGINNYITFHAVIEKNSNIKLKLREKLKQFNIYHSTIEFEYENEECLIKECNSDIKRGKDNHWK